MFVKMYCQLQTFLKKIVKRDGEFSGFDNELVRGCDAGLELFNEYFNYIQQNDIYLIASVLDSRVKSRWVKKNLTMPTKSLLGFGSSLRTHTKKRQCLLKREIKVSTRHLSMSSFKNSRSQMGKSCRIMISIGISTPRLSSSCLMIKPFSLSSGGVVTLTCFL